MKILSLIKTATHVTLKTLRQPAYFIAEARKSCCYYSGARARHTRKPEKTATLQDFQL